MTQAAILAASGSPGTTTGFKNRVINGGMTIDQRNAGASISVSTDSGQYVVDRMNSIAQGGGAYSAQQTTTAPAGFNNSIKLTVTTADASVSGTDYYCTRHRFEGYNTADLNWGTANAQSVTISFWVQASVTGTYSIGLTATGSTATYCASYTISTANTWTKVSITVPGPTIGTWQTTTSSSIELFIPIGLGTTYGGTAGTWTAGSYYMGITGTTNLISTLGATFYLTGLQLEVGTTATNFDFRSYGTELALCQRYYEKSYNIDVVPGTGTGEGRVFTIAMYQSASLLDYGGSVPFRVQKRVTPTIAFWREDGTSNSWNYNTASGGGNLASILVARVGTSCFATYGTGSGLSNTSTVISGHWTASSEL